MKKVICLFGPTATGKTDVSIQTAKKFNLEIISADSMQVYREMDIGTAKISEKQMQDIKHHLINIRNPDEYFSTMEFFNICTGLINQNHEQNRPAFVVGGTGLYFKALFNGMAPGPGKNPGLRAELEQSFKNDNLALYHELKNCDPVYAKRVHPNDMKRVVRGLEVYKTGGKPLSSIENSLPDYDYLKIGILPQRSKVYEKINRRCCEMVEKGLIKETEKLIEKYGENHNAFNAIGYSHAIKFLHGEYDKNEFLRLFKRDTRRFAKRQYTLFKRFKDVFWLTTPDKEKIFKAVQRFLYE